MTRQIARLIDVSPEYREAAREYQRRPTEENWTRAIAAAMRYFRKESR